MEVQIGNLELELCLTCGNCSSFLVLGDKAEGGFSGESGIRCIRPFRGIFIKMRNFI